MPGLYWFSVKHAPFYPAPHNWWSINWVDDEWGPGLGEIPGNQKWFKGTLPAGGAPPANLVGLAGCSASCEHYPPPSVATIGNYPAACWPPGGPIPPIEVNVIENVTLSDKSRNCPLVVNLQFDVSAQFALTCLGGNIALVGLNTTGNGLVVLQNQAILLGVFIGQVTINTPAITIQASFAGIQTGDAYVVLAFGGSTKLFSFDWTGTLTSGKIPAVFVTGLAPSATIDTTNAGNITSGTLLVSVLPASVCQCFASHQTGTTAAAYVTLFNVSDGRGLHGSFWIKNTGNLNGLQMRITATDMYGTQQNTVTTVGQGLGSGIALDSTQINQIHPPYSQFQIEVEDAVANQHTTYDAWLSYN